MANSGPLREDDVEAGGLSYSEMVGTGEDRPSGCEGMVGGSGGRGVGEGRRRDGAVGDDGQELKAGGIT